MFCFPVAAAYYLWGGDLQVEESENKREIREMLNYMGSSVFDNKLLVSRSAQ